MENFSEGFFVLAVLVITFINWVSDQLKRRAAKKRGEPVEEEDGSKYIFFEDEAESDQETSLGQSESARGPREDPNEEIRRFFEAISGQAPVVEAPRPEPQFVEETPPPVPKVARASAKAAGQIPEETVKKPELNAEEKAALERYQRMINAGGIARRAEARAASTDALRDILRNKDSVRQAILINEILAKPKGLQA